MPRLMPPPAVRAHAIATARQVKLNAVHLYHDPAKCEIAGRLFNRCKHGVTVDDHTGRDLLCGWCESDVSPYAFGLDSAWTKQRTIVGTVTTELLAAARRADAAGEPRAITAESVYGKTVDGPPVDCPVWQWLTPADLVTVSMLIAALGQAKPTHAK